MSCKRCGDPEVDHSENALAVPQECDLYRIGTQLARIADSLERLTSYVVSGPAFPLSR